MRRIILISSLLLGFCDTLVAAKIYKWVDEQGITHFTERPPQDRESTTITTTSAPANSATVKAPITSTKITDPEQAAIDAKVKRQVAAEEAERQRVCNIYRNNLAQMEQNPRVRVEENGQMRRIGEEERQQRMADTRKAISENCL